MQYKKLFILTLITVSILMILQSAVIITMFAVIGAGMAVVDGVARSGSTIYIILISLYYICPFILFIISLVIINKKFTKYLLQACLTVLISSFVPLIIALIHYLAGIGMTETNGLWELFPFIHIAFSVVLFFVLKFGLKKHST